MRRWLGTLTSGVGILAVVWLIAMPTAALGQTPEQTLTQRPFAPTDRGLLSTSVYPDAPAMAPAAGGEPTSEQVASRLDAYLAEQFPGDNTSQDAARALFNDPATVAKIPSPSLRAALVGLNGTFAAPAVDYILHAQRNGHDEVKTVRFAQPSEMPDPTRAIGAVYTVGDQFEIRFNARYQAEDPFLFVPVMAHEALHLGNGEVANTEEQINTSMDGLLGIDGLARHPGLATLGTELSRRYNTRALVRLNSGTGSTLGLYATNGGAQLFPGSTTATGHSWFEDSGGDQAPTQTPGFSLLETLLGAIHAPGAPVCSGTSFEKPTLDCIDAQGNGGLSSDTLVAAANALRLDTTTPAGPGDSGACDQAKAKLAKAKAKLRKLRQDDAPQKKIKKAKQKVAKAKEAVKAAC